MGVVKVEVKVVEDGGWINWVDEVEEENTEKYFKVVKVERREHLKAAVRKRVKTNRMGKCQTTYPYEMRLGTYLAMKEGEVGMRRLFKLGVKTHERLEELYVEQVISRELGVCANPLNAEFQKFNVEALGEEAVKKLIRSWQSGLKTEARKNPENGKTNYYVRLLAMSPGQGDPIRAEKEEQEQQTGEDSKPRPEVNKFLFILALVS